MMSQNSSAKPKWINVKKQLPPEWEEVLMRYAEIVQLDIAPLL